MKFCNFYYSLLYLYGMDNEYGIIEWHPLDDKVLEQLSLQTYNDKIKFLQNCEKNNLTDDNYFNNHKSIPAIKFIWKNSKHNSDTIILQLHYLICNSHEKRYIDNLDKCEILLKNMLNKDAGSLTVKDKLQILYGNEWRFKEVGRADIIDKMFEKLSTPEKTVIYPHDNANYRFIVKDKFVFLQKLMKNNKYYEIADLTKYFEEDFKNKIPTNKQEFCNYIKNHTKDILAGCDKLDEDDKQQVCELLNIQYEKPTQSIINCPVCNLCSFGCHIC